MLGMITWLHGPAANALEGFLDMEVNIFLLMPNLLPVGFFLLADQEPNWFTESRIRWCFRVY